MKRSRTPTSLERRNFWFQVDAFDILQADLGPKKGFRSGLLAYRMLAAIASETDAEPGPEHDGLPFNTTLARVALESNQPPALTLARLRDCERLGLIDPFVQPEHPGAAITFRLCALADELVADNGKARLQ